MQTTIDPQGQITIPQAIREHFHLDAGDYLEWRTEGETIRLIPVSQNLDPITVLYGIGRGEGLGEKLLESRRQERHDAK